MILPAPPLRHLQRVRGALVEGTARKKRTQARTTRLSSNSSTTTTTSCTIPKNKWVWLCGSIAVFVVYMSIVGHLHQRSVQGDRRMAAENNSGSSDLPHAAAQTGEGKKVTKRAAMKKNSDNNRRSKLSTTAVPTNGTASNLGVHTVRESGEESNDTAFLLGKDQASVGASERPEQQLSTASKIDDRESQVVESPATTASKRKRRRNSHA